MRIAMVSEHASPLATLGGVDAGGQNVHVAALSSALAARGHHVTVYTRRDDEDLPERATLCEGVEVVHVTAGPAAATPKDDLLPHMPAFADRLAEYWHEDAPDLVHSHFWMSGLASIDAARRHGLSAVSGHTGPPAFPTLPGPSGLPGTSGLAVAHTFHALGVVKRRHQGVEDTSPAQRAELEPRVGRAADVVIATCSDEAFELLALGIRSTRISVVPCGVDTALFRPDGDAEPKTRPFRVVSVGRLVPRKGVGCAISALGELARRGRDDIELVVVGGSHGAADAASDPDVQRLAALAAAEGVGHLVSFRGQVAHAQLPRVLRSADAVVCAPWYEPFGIVPLEAMAAGVPVIATAVGGLIDTVVHGRTGLHVPPRDPSAIADALTTLLSDPVGMRELGAAGAARARARYTWDRVAAETEQVYRRTLARRGAEPAATTEAARR